MFKNLAKLSFVLLISISLISPIFAQNQKQQTPEDYGKYLEQTRRDVQKFNIQVLVKTPQREGRDSTSYGSGFAVFEQKNQTEDANGKVIKYTTYYICTAAHVVGDETWDLEDYQKHNVRIYILGKNNVMAPARIVAWEWGSESLLLRVDILESELDIFKIRVAKIADKLPVSLFDSKFNDENVDTLFLSGYPGTRPSANSGYVQMYYYNYNLNEYTSYAKVAVVDVEGVSGQGQSGGAVFNKNFEVVGMTVAGLSYLGSNLSIIVTIDVIVERFLKQLPELAGLTLPKFELEKEIKNKPIFLGRPKKETITAANHLNN